MVTEIYNHRNTTQWLSQLGLIVHIPWACVAKINIPWPWPWPCSERIDRLQVSKYVQACHGHGHGHGIFILATHPEGIWTTNPKPSFTQHPSADLCWQYYNLTESGKSESVGFQSLFRHVDFITLQNEAFMAIPDDVVWHCTLFGAAHVSVTKKKTSTLTDHDWLSYIWHNIAPRVCYQKKTSTLPDHDWLSYIWRSIAPRVF